MFNSRKNARKQLKNGFAEIILLCNIFQYWDNAKPCWHPLKNSYNENIFEYYKSLITVKEMTRELN